MYILRISHWCRRKCTQRMCSSLVSYNNLFLPQFSPVPFGQILLPSTACCSCPCQTFDSMKRDLDILGVPVGTTERWDKDRRHVNGFGMFPAIFSGTDTAPEMSTLPTNASFCTSLFANVRRISPERPRPSRNAEMCRRRFPKSKNAPHSDIAV